MKFTNKSNPNYIYIILFFWLITCHFLVFSPIHIKLKSEYSTLSPKVSNYWIVSNKIYINNNWSDSEATYDFISGSGTFNDPFIIENITLTDIKNVNNFIIIENSSDYFIIRNCKIMGSGASLYNAGIKIINSTKGILINNTISSNTGTGISLIKSYNISVFQNSLFNNSYIGIGLNESHNNLIFQNDANYQGKGTTGGYGIVLFKSDNNSLTRNAASYNNAIGFLLVNSSLNNLTLNTANNNYLGLHLTQNSNYNSIINNNLKKNTYCYIVDNDCEENILDNDCGTIGFEFYFFLIAFGSVFALSLIGFILALKKRKKIKKERNRLK